MMAPDLYARSIQDSSTGGRFNLREKKMAGPSQSSDSAFALSTPCFLVVLSRPVRWLLKSRPRRAPPKTREFSCGKRCGAYEWMWSSLMRRDILLRFAGLRFSRCRRRKAAVHPPVRIPER